MNPRWSSALVVALVTLIGSGCTEDHNAARAKACPPFDMLDLNMLPRIAAADENRVLDTGWRSWRALHGRPTSPTSFEIYVNQAWAMRNGSFDFRGAREDGGWKLTARYDPVYEGTPGWTPWREINITPGVSQHIDRLLADDCLWATPRYLPGAVPLADGSVAASHHGPLAFFDIRKGDKQWGGIQDSWSVGPPARLRSLLMEVAFHASSEGPEDFQSGQILTREEAALTFEAFR